VFALCEFNGCWIWDGVVYKSKHFLILLWLSCGEWRSIMLKLGLVCVFSWIDTFKIGFGAIVIAN